VDFEGVVRVSSSKCRWLVRFANGAKLMWWSDGATNVVVLTMGRFHVMKLTIWFKGACYHEWWRW